MEGKRVNFASTILIAGFMMIILTVPISDLIFRHNLFGAAERVHDKQFEMRPAQPNLNDTSRNIGDIARLFPSEVLRRKFGIVKTQIVKTDSEGFIQPASNTATDCNVVVAGDSFTLGHTPTDSIAGLITRFSKGRLKAFNMGFQGYPVNSLLAFLEIYKPLSRNEIDNTPKKYLVVLISKQNMYGESISDVFTRYHERTTCLANTRRSRQLKTLIPSNLFEDLQKHSLLRRAGRRIVEKVDMHLYSLKALRQSPVNTEGVIIGRDGMLFYPGEVFFFRTPPSKDSILLFTDVMDFMKCEAARRGFDLIVALAPNKSDIYPQFLPPEDRPSADDPSFKHFTAIFNSLDSKKITAVNLLPPLRTEAASYIYLFYYKDDTHWNVYGRSVAAKEIIKAIH